MTEPIRLNELLAEYLEDAARAGVTELPPGGAGSIPETAPAPAKEAKQTVPLPVLEEETVESVLAKLRPDTMPAEKGELLKELAEIVSRCRLCPELASTRTQTVFGTGNPGAELVFIGEGPGADEDRQGLPFVGRSGQLLTDIITKGMKMTREEVYICNIVRCRPPGNRNPSIPEATCCRPFLDATLKVIAPRYICCLGSVAALNLLKTDTPIGRLRGKVYDYQGAKVVCTYHPAYLLRNPPAKKPTWEDIKILLHEMGRM